MGIGMGIGGGGCDHIVEPKTLNMFLKKKKKKTEGLGLLVFFWFELKSFPKP